MASKLEDSTWDARFGAAHALGNARAGSSALFARLRVERNRYVLAEICDALAVVGDASALPRLRRIAREHYWPLVRGAALLAVTDIEGRTSVPFLRERLDRDSAPRVKALAHCALARYGSPESLAALRRLLASRDIRLRELIGNTLASFGRLPAPLRKLVKEFAAAETTRVVKVALARALPKTGLTFMFETPTPVRRRPPRCRDR